MIRPLVRAYPEIGHCMPRSEVRRKRRNISDHKDIVLALLAAGAEVYCNKVDRHLLNVL